MKATQSFAQDRGTGATPAAGAQAGATQGTFTTSDAIPWKPVDPKKPDGVQMFVVWGNPNRGASMILQKAEELLAQDEQHLEPGLAAVPRQDKKTRKLVAS